MTFGEQNTLAESFQLMDQAFHAGINFFDSAEMYPVPQRAHTCGRSEECLGRWISQRKIPRDSLVIASKVLFFCLVRCYVSFLQLNLFLLQNQVAGPSGQMTWIRGGPKCLDADNITEAIDNRLLPLLILSLFTPYMQTNLLYRICRVSVNPSYSHYLMFIRSERCWTGHIILVETVSGLFCSKLK